MSMRIGESLLASLYTYQINLEEGKEPGDFLIQPYCILHLSLDVNFSISFFI